MKWGWTTSSNNLESVLPLQECIIIISTTMANTVNTFLINVKQK